MAMEAFRAAASTCCWPATCTPARPASTANRYQSTGYAALVIQAGTATSTRGRGEANSFNVLRVANREIVIERQLWQPDATAFALERTERFRRVDNRWIEA